MGKRANVQKEAPAAKVAKTEDAFVEKMAPVQMLVAEAPELSEECREMVGAMALHCLKTPKSERHPYQEMMAGVLTEISASVEVRCSASVQAAETKIAELEVDKNTSADALVAANNAADAQREVKEAKDSELQSAEGITVAARAKAAAEGTSKDGLAEEHKANIANKTEFEVVYTEQWTPAKDGTLEGSWQKKAKVVEAALKPLQELGLDNSLLDALPVAIKVKPADRKSFATTAVEYGEAAFKKHIANLDEKIANVDAEATVRAKAFEEAEAALKAAEEQQEVCKQGVAGAENELKELTEVFKSSDNLVKSLGPKSKALAKALANEQRHLELAREHAAHLLALIECPEPEVVAEEAASETAAEAITAEAPMAVEVAA